MSAQQPLLYAVGFLSSHPLCSHKDLIRAIRAENLRTYGTVKAPNISRPFHVIETAHLRLFLTHWHEDPSKRFGLTSYEIDDMLQRTIALETAQGTLHPQQAHLEATACNDLVWVSDFAHHGGKTAPNVTLGNPTHTPWTASEDEELQAIAAETYEGKRLRGWRDKPLGRYAMFARKHGRTVAAVTMRAKRLGAKSYYK